MNLLALKNRIRSVKNIGQITKAMELVAATKMKKAQQRIQDANNYKLEIENIVRRIIGSEDLSEFALAKKNDSEKNLLIIIGPSKGLAGSLISNLSREAYKYLKENSNTDLITIDKKGGYIGERSGKNIIGALAHIKTNIKEDELSGIFALVEEEYKKGNYKKVSVVFTHFINTLVQKPMIVDLLPVSFDYNNIDTTTNVRAEDFQPLRINNTDILIEPNKTAVINNLLQKYYENKLFTSVLDNIASEFSARMIAMKNANDNASEIKDDLTLEYNQSRQAAITQQILEIAGATAAMEGEE